MKKSQALFSGILFACTGDAQTLTCSDPVYRPFDFWVEERVAFGLNGKRAGDSKVSIILTAAGKIFF